MAHVNFGMQLTTQLETKIKLEDERYRMASERAWEINAALIRCDMARDSDDKNTLVKEDATLEELVRETVLCTDMYNNIVHENNDGGYTITAVHSRAPRLGSLGNKMEDYARYKAFQHYLSEEKLLSPNAPCFTTAQDDQRNILTDEEYLGGACIGLCHDLAKYGVTRASNAVEDTAAVPFITRARDVVSSILEELLQFDFRNGPLRRKYDSTKYALKTLETILYELSVAGASYLAVQGENDNLAQNLDLTLRSFSELGVNLIDGCDYPFEEPSFDNAAVLVDYSDKCCN